MSNLVLTVDVMISAGTPKNALVEMKELAERLQINVKGDINGVTVEVFYPITYDLLQIERDSTISHRYDDLWALIVGGE